MEEEWIDDDLPQKKQPNYAVLEFIVTVFVLAIVLFLFSKILFF